jgi:uncharacterized protein YhfF
VSDELARAEGEGFADAAEYRDAHLRFWSDYTEEIREQLGDPAWEVTLDTPVVMERFRLTQRFG